MPHFGILTLTVLLLGACSAGPPDPDAPVTLTRGDLTLTVEPRSGGRVSSLTFRGRELLKTTRDSLGFQWGSTAWPSPQSRWNWPPPAVLDGAPYTVQRKEAHSVLLISAEDPATGLTLQKRFRLGPDADVGCTYWLTYRGPDTLTVAVWENTRLPYAGRLEFAADSVRVTELPGDAVEGDPPARVIHFDDRHPGNGKVFADLDTTPVRYYVDDLVLEKYTAVRELYRVAPGQAPLEVYLAPQDGFWEFELQGDYRRLSYGQNATLRTRWRVTEAQAPNQ